MTLTNQDLLAIQHDDATITPTELIEVLRASGRRVSRRTLSFWQSQSLIPPALRVGARGGVHPRSVMRLAAYVFDGRERGWSIDVIRELSPLWRYTAEAELAGCISVAEFERVARSLDLSREATYQVPALLEHTILTLCDDCRSALTWSLKDGTVVDGEGGVRLRFVVAEMNADDGMADIVAFTQLTIPGLGEWVDVDDPALVVLGVANGFELRRTCGHGRRIVHRPRSTRNECPARPSRARTSLEVQQLQLTT
jgi:DNA-binding transcriptional MerR regulator